MKNLKLFCACALFLFWAACTNEELIMPSSDMNIGERTNQQQKATGDVEILWKGKGGNQQGESEDTIIARRGFVSFVAFAPAGNKDAKGNFTFEVMENNTVHRQIIADVTAAVVNPDIGKAWFLAEVIYDSQPCGNQGGSGDHEDGEDCGHEDGDDCGHDDEGAGGHDDGCSGDDADHGNNQGSDQQCRIGQIVAVKVHDVGTPATEGDGITWKWFNADAPNLPDIEMTESWQHLCKKTILAGNLVVH